MMKETQLSIGSTERAEDLTPDVRTDEGVLVGRGVLPAPRSRLALPPALRAGAAAWIWIGIAIVAGGFILIAVGWGRVAAETQVYLQMPYVVSAALVGLGVVMIGLTVVNIVARQRDGIDRDRQITQLVTILEELKDALEERDRR